MGLRRVRALFVIGWMFYSLGYYDNHGRFILSVRAIRSTTQDACERTRRYADEAWYVVIPRCVRDDEGPETYEQETAESQPR